MNFTNMPNGTIMCDNSVVNYAYNVVTAINKLSYEKKVFNFMFFSKKIFHFPSKVSKLPEFLHLYMEYIHTGVWKNETLLTILLQSPSIKPTGTFTLNLDGGRCLYSGA